MEIDRAVAGLANRLLKATNLNASILTKPIYPSTLRTPKPISSGVRRPATRRFRWRVRALRLCAPTLLTAPHALGVGRGGRQVLVLRPYVEVLALRPHAAVDRGGRQVLALRPRTAVLCFKASYSSTLL